MVEVAVYQVVVPNLGVYSYPYGLGQHRTSESLAKFQKGDLVKVFESFSTQHPRCGFVWRKLVDFEGWIIEKHVFTDTTYLLWHTGVDI